MSIFNLLMNRVKLLMVLGPLLRNFMLSTSFCLRRVLKVVELTVVLLCPCSSNLSSLRIPLMKCMN